MTISDIEQVSKTAIETIEVETLKDRLRATFEVLLEDSKIPKPLLSLGRSFFENFINNTSEENVAGILRMMRDELIPFLLDEDGQNKT